MAVRRFYHGGIISNMERKHLLRSAAFALNLMGVLASASAAEAATVINTHISTSTSWTKEGSPYLIENSIDVKAGATLSIGPGTIVKFKHSQYGDAVMSVFGSLRINGSPEDRARFTAGDDDSIGGDAYQDGNTFDQAFPYSWEIYFYSATNSVISNAEFHNYGIISIRNTDIAVSGVTSRHSQGGLHFIQGKSSITDSTFADMAWAGINMDSGDLDVSSTTISDIKRDAGLSITYGKLRVSNVTIRNPQGRAGLYAAKSQVTIADSIFEDGPSSGGLELSESQTSISTSTVADFAGNAIGVFGGSFTADRLSIERNGSGIYLENNFWTKAPLETGIISNSRFVGNRDHGVMNNSPTKWVDARNNWWGHVSGPRTNDMGSTGQGNMAVGYMNFTPWLERDPWAPKSASELPTVMFIPGLEASRLYADSVSGPRRLWEPSPDKSFRSLYLDGSGATLNDGIYTRDVVDEVYGTWYLENIYKSFLNGLAKWKTDGDIADYSTIPYDWRLTLDDILAYGNIVDGKIYYSGKLRETEAPYIYRELKRLAAASDGKITLIAHSNGGLVTKALLKQLADRNDPLLQRIEKVILVAVPQTGTPVAAGALLHGFDQALGPFGSVMNAVDAREFGRNMPGAYPLVPSASYSWAAGSGVSTPVITFQNSGFAPISDAIRAYGTSIDTAAELEAFLRGDEGRVEPQSFDIASPGKANAALISYGSAVHASLDRWEPPSSITVHQIAGWGVPTLATIDYRSKISGCAQWSDETRSLCLRYSSSWTYTPVMTIDGDGTVVTPSALAMSTSSPNVKRWWVDMDQHNDDHIVNRKHKNILEIDEVENSVRQIVRYNIASTSQIIYQNPPPSIKTNRLIFILHSPLDLYVINSKGQVLSSTTQNILGGKYIRFGEVQYVSVPADSMPIVKLEGQSAGYFDLDIAQTEGETIIATTSFSAIQSTTSTLANISFTDGLLEHASALDIDTDGNGETDLSLKPKLNGKVTMPKPLTVSVDNKAMTIGDRVPILTYALNGFENGDTASSSIAGVADCMTTATENSPVGTYPITCTVGTLSSDKYYFASFTPAALKITYRFDGFTQPINDTKYHPEQARSFFKAGSTVPVKFQLKNNLGKPVQAAASPLWIAPVRIGPMNGTVGESVYTETSTSGGAYKWDLSAQQYMYNWGTKGLVAGYWYRIGAQLDDGTAQSVIIGIR